MRVAILVTDFPSVSETFILNQITGLLDRGHEVAIFAEREGERSPVHPDVERYDLLSITSYERMPHKRLRRLLNSPKLLLTRDHRSFIVRLRALNFFKHGAQAASLKLLHAASQFADSKPYDIIHCHFGSNGVKGALLRDAGALRGKLVTSFHGYDLSAYTKERGAKVYQTLFRKGDLFLPVSERWKARLVEMNCPRDKIKTHRSGIDLDAFAFREPHAPADGRVALITVARLVEKKGLEYAVRAVAQLIKEGRLIEYDIIGDGALREYLQSVIDEAGMGGAIRLVGWKSRADVREMLRRSHIFLGPSVTGHDGDEEGIPVSLMEAMATGLPVVCTAHSGIPELVQDSVSGFLVPERDALSLAERLSFLIDREDSWRELARRARSVVEERHDIGKLNDELVEIYRRLIYSD
ncbi:MAG: colanic acid/amylovoran biosynthesis glycosyltransferase [Acidobacteriota bacterium]|nr:colanic acid/amylovoran biosynthesis glycosyltransferase [Acidobacteriota bacterium]